MDGRKMTRIKRRGTPPPPIPQWKRECPVCKEHRTIGDYDIHWSEEGDEFSHVMRCCSHCWSHRSDMWQEELGALREWREREESLLNHFRALRDEERVGHIRDRIVEIDKRISVWVDLVMKGEE